MSWSARMPIEPQSRTSPRTLGLIGVLGVCLATTIVITGIMARAKTDESLKTWTTEQAVPTVAVAPPNARELTATLDLPGRLEAFNRPPVFARVSRDLNDWGAEIVPRVKR